MKDIWTTERRNKQSEAINSWKPWTKSSGPQTDEGKETSKMNALKHGAYSKEIKELERIL